MENMLWRPLTGKPIEQEVIIAWRKLPENMARLYLELITRPAFVVQRLRDGYLAAVPIDAERFLWVAIGSEVVGEDWVEVNVVRRHLLHDHTKFRPCENVTKNFVSHLNLTISVQNPCLPGERLMTLECHSHERCSCLTTHYFKPHRKLHILSHRRKEDGHNSPIILNF